MKEKSIEIFLMNICIKFTPDTITNHTMELEELYKRNKRNAELLKLALKYEGKKCGQNWALNATYP